MYTNRSNSLVAIILSIFLFIAVMPVSSYADTATSNNPKSITYVDAQTGLAIDGTVFDETHLIITASIGTDTATCERIGNNYYLDGKLIDSGIPEQLTILSGLQPDILSTRAVDTTGVSWSDWTQHTETWNVYKLAAAGICALISSYLFGQGLFVIPSLTSVASAVIAAGYDYLKLSLKIRIGYNSATKYDYAQQQYTFYGKYSGRSYQQIGSTETLTQKKASK